MNLHTLLKAIPFAAMPAANPEITEITNNSKTVTKGSLFVCISGHNADGHRFVPDAVERGAAAILAEKEVEADIPVVKVRDTKKTLAILADAFYGHPTQKLHLVGVTGTNGKTTTTHLLEHVFRQSGQRTGLIGTMYTKIGGRVSESKNTTPDSAALQSIFSEMAESGVESAFMEVSSHGLVQGRVDGCDFDVAVFTNLSQDHLDYHKTMEEYRRAKGLLFSRLGNAYHGDSPKFAVLNADDEASGEYMTDTAAHIVTYGIERDADFRASGISLDGSGTRFTLRAPEGEFEVSLGLIGIFNVYNVLAAIAAAYVSGLEMEAILRAVQTAKGVGGRFEAVQAGQDFAVIVDYAHTPDGLENVLKTVRQFAEGRVFTVVGCGGDRDRTKRPLMAEIACRYSTDPIFTSDNPRSEEPAAILKDMEAGVEGQDYLSIEDRREAIRHAVGSASAGDVILIAGKGHETYQIVGSDILDFDDRLVAREAIKDRAERG